MRANGRADAATRPLTQVANAFARLGQGRVNVVTRPLTNSPQI
jgi:hypothetical protein